MITYSILFSIKYRHKEEITMEITSVLEFIEQIENIVKKNTASEKLYFRGENNIFPLRIPSIYREKDGKSIFSRLYNESPREYYFKLFEELGWPITDYGQKMFEKMVEAQHYGAVTNILDITSNPLIALFFACYGGKNKDGKVYIYKTNDMYIEHYFNRKVTIMTALNFIERIKVDKFITLFKEFEKVSPTGKFLEIFVDSTFTTENIIESLSSIFNHDGTDIPEFFLMDFESYQIPFTNIKVNYLGEVISENRCSEEVIQEITSLLQKLLNKDEYESYKDVFEDMDINTLQSYLLGVMRTIMDDFLNQLNEYARTREQIIYPLDVYKIITRSYVVKASKINERIKNQRGAFIVPSYIPTAGKTIKQFQDELDESIRNNIGLNTAFTIPSTSKVKILRQLKIIGIDEGFIYPEVANIAKATLDKYKD